MNKYGLLMCNFTGNAYLRAMKTIETVDAAHIRDRFQSDRRPRNLMDGHFVLVRQSDVVTQKANLGQPMRLAECRILHVVGGQAVYRINLVDHTLASGDVLMLPPDTIVEVLSLTADYSVEALAIIDFPGIDHELAKRTFPVEVMHLSMGDDDRKRMGGYFDMIARQMGREEHSDAAVSFLILSMVSDAVALHSSLFARNSSRRKLSRSEEIMSRFHALLRQHGTTQRNVPFYADLLAITPNHLSDVVRQQSGLSVMDWLNRTTTTEAKVLLKHSDLMIYEIGERLNFPEPTAFNRYFKKQVGMTPLQYRGREVESTVLLALFTTATGRNRIVVCRYG